MQPGPGGLFLVLGAVRRARGRVGIGAEEGGGGFRAKGYAPKHSPNPPPARSSFGPSDHPPPPPFNPSHSSHFHELTRARAHKPGTVWSDYNGHTAFSSRRLDDESVEERGTGPGGAVNEWLDCSHTSKANLVQYPAGSLADFHKWKSHPTIPYVNGFYQISPVFPTLEFLIIPRRGVENRPIHPPSTNGEDGDDGDEDFNVGGGWRDGKTAFQQEEVGGEGAVVDMKPLRNRASVTPACAELSAVAITQ
ncbi:hypothetical protein PR048_006111 [Dryococelus australis]|uniref:Uncharacterized protein n=1 Tax=Dryococelus australis TaxID=614101 RepID=A0ABQ9IC94_9NEOP|nr:hypothetical protein PR048_006111 [Dryococelus australis]